MQEYLIDSNEESYILSNKPQYMVMLMPQYLKKDSNTISNYYDVLNKKYSKSKKDLIFNINKKVIKQTRKDFYDINKDLVLNVNQKYFIYDRYDNNKRNEFTVKKIDLVDFKKLKTIYRNLGFSSIEELKKSLKTISIEKNYIEFNHNDTDKCVMLVYLEWN